MAYIIFILAIIIIISIVISAKKNEANYQIDILNDFTKIYTVIGLKIKDIKIFRIREISYINRTFLKEIPIGQNNDVITNSNQLNTVQDIAIVIKGISESGNSVIIMQYEYSIENKEKALKLKEYLRTEEYKNIRTCY